MDDIKNYLDGKTPEQKKLIGDTICFTFNNPSKAFELLKLIRGGTDE